MPDHPLLAGIAAGDHLRDWRGEATILPPRLDYELRPRYGPTVKWCDIPVTRVWRCGNRGNVASVLIEKPARGNFLPILDGGFSLQYSPLLEYREGQGLVLFCQLDVTGRTETDPAAESLVRNHPQVRVDLEAGPGPERRLRRRSSRDSAISNPPAFAVGAFRRGEPVTRPGPRGRPRRRQELAASAPAIADWLKAGGNVLAIGLDEQDANAFLPFQVRMKKAEHISAYFDPIRCAVAVRGRRAGGCPQPRPRELPLITAGATVIGDGVLARAEGLQRRLLPARALAVRGRCKQPNIKRTFRRASFLVSRLLANMGVDGATPILDRFHTPVAAAPPRSAG